MTQPEAQEGQLEEMPSLPIQFQGREMFVTMPGPSQLAVWRRILHRLQSTPENSWTADAVVDSLVKLHRIVDTLLVEPADKNWLEDEILDGRLTFPQLAPIITEATEAFQAKAAEEGNRETRRAAKKTAPAKKAALKAPARRKAS